MLTQITGGLRRRMNGDDSGFSMFEVVVAMSVFAVMVAAALTIIPKTLGVVKSNANRVAAANLATKQIESARSQLTIDIPDGAVTRTEVVAGITYTIVQNAEYVVGGSTTNACVGAGGVLSYKLVTAIVTWPNMGTVKPVRADTLKALGIGDEGLDPTLGALAVGVFGATGNAIAGIDVTITAASQPSQTQTTGSDGCAVFVGLATGGTATSTIDYTATVNQAGYVGSADTQIAKVVQAVQGGRVIAAQILYDTERTIDVQYDVLPVGTTAPIGMPLRFRNSYFSAGSALQGCATAPAGQGCLTALPGTAKHMFPAAYEFWAGSCVDAKVSPDTLDARTADGAVQVPLAGANVLVKNSLGVVQSGKAVTATHAGDVVLGGCPTGEVWSLPVTNALGVSLGALPYGKWTISTPGAPSQVVTLAPSPPAFQNIVLVTP